MIQGLNTFKEFFNGYEESYTLIGGVACYLSMEDAGLDFRATKDIDIVLCTEALDAEFAQRFWTFIKAGEYEHQEKSTGGRQFYRFTKPASTDYPAMLELFSRKPEDALLEGDADLTPIPVDEDVSSLSAILLDDDYYQCIQDGKEILDSVSILKVEYIIPFKMKAWSDLIQRKANGEKVDSKNIKKHKNDVLKISQLLSPQLQVELPDSIKDDMRIFIAGIADDAVDMKNLGLAGLTLKQIIDSIHAIYRLN
ncbi:hypothetical protein A8139_05285 [Marinomonas primoryensis]|uniref:Uncharacterized protein n=1 Tax=Marinomonas primoryensis TaxID=178399 RepID=A0A2Z4PPM2_9GAMM|nr:hypothetical protein [Marinomonas primoryensis]AWX99475.1 hypothetical protein A8139_05285 [Marinomonas primoryensis]